MNINRNKLLRELSVLERIYGYRNIEYSASLEWIMIANFHLPRNYRQEFTSILIKTPNYYGYNARWEEIYLNPELRILKKGKWAIPPHYHSNSSDYFNKYIPQGWRYFCIRRASKNLIEFLKQVKDFLSDPWRF